MIWDVTEVKITEPSTLWIRFADGTEGSVKFLPTAFRGVFSRLREDRYFRDFPCLEYGKRGKVMLGLSVREEFRGKRRKATAIELSNDQPITRQFLRTFGNAPDLRRDQIEKFLNGSITTPDETPDEFVRRGWCAKKNKVYPRADPLDLAREWSVKHVLGSLFEKYEQ